MNENVFDSLLEPVFIVNKDLIVLYCNESASQLTSLSIRKIVKSQKILTELLQFKSNIDLFTQLSSIKDPTPYIEIEFSTVLIQEGKAQLTIQLFSNNSWLVYFRDVTLEERLQKKYRSELEKKEKVINDLEIAKIQLEIYSKQLESLVAERTKEITSLNKMMKALLDSLNQGFFVFHPDGKCLPFYSKACLKIIECDPSYKFIWDVLNVEADKILGFKNWLLTLFSEMLPFEDLTPLGPSRRRHSLNREVSIEYFPIRNESQLIEAVVCVASDITDLVEAKIQAEKDRTQVEAILKIVQHKKQAELFYNESEKGIKRLSQLLAKTIQVDDSDEVIRILHTLKGGAASFSFVELKTICHDMESFYLSIKSNPNEHELKQLQNCLFTLQEAFKSVTAHHYKIFGSMPASSDKRIEMELTDFLKIIEQLPSTQQINFLENKYLYETISNHVLHFKNVTSSTAKQLKKEISPLKMSGENILVPKNKFDYLFQVLVHCLRNSIDHGIELPENRIKVSKPVCGQIEINFSLIENVDTNLKCLQIALKDDGQGIDPNKIREKLLKMKSPMAQQSDAEIIYRIFDSSFSTKDDITEISGRGVGMNAVLAEVTALGGVIHIESKVGAYSHFIIQVPFANPHSLSRAA
jgi:two-component system chemotaxis sensor kinase CheA